MCESELHKRAFSALGSLIGLRLGRSVQAPTRLRAEPPPPRVAAYTPVQQRERASSEG